MNELILFDTNSLVSASLFENSILKQAFNKALEYYQFITSNDCYSEIEEVIQRPKFSKYITPNQANDFLKFYKIKTIFVPITSIITDCRDEKDNKFLELAMSADSKIIVTGDADLLVLHPYNSIKIITPRQFLDDDF
jgi:uncharacterized protein